jgi:hypothetical protein
VRCTNLDLELSQLCGRESGRRWHVRELVVLWQRRGIMHHALADPFMIHVTLWVDMSGSSQQRVDSESRIRAYATELPVSRPRASIPERE